MALMRPYSVPYRYFSIRRALFVWLCPVFLGAGCVVAGPDVPLTGLASRYGMKIAASDDMRVEVSGKGCVMTLKADSREMTFNGIRVWLHAPALKHRRRWLVSKTDAETVVQPLLSVRHRPVSARPFKVMLDPGHGGVDSGAIGLSGRHEKDLVLDIAERTRQRLVQADVTVRMTREADIGVGLRERPSLAEAWGADIFVSIHLNSASNSDANGLETFVLTAANAPSTNTGATNGIAYPGHRHAAANMVLAYHAHRRLLQRTGAADRGIRHARFEALKHATCPAILVEGGFLSHPEEEQKLLSASYRDRIAEALADGILDYAGRTSAPGKDKKP